MIYLILSILCAAMVSIAMRLSEGKIQSKMSMIAMNYVACMAVGIAYMGIGNLIPRGEGTAPMLAMGIFNGVFYMFGLVLNQYNIPRNGVVLSSVFSKMGALLVPLVMSIVIFREEPSLFQVVGFVLSTVSIVMICNRSDAGAGEESAKWALFLLFLADGFAGIMAKVFREAGNPALGDHFLFLTFFTAFVLCVVVVFVKRERPGSQEVLYGLMIGIPNFMSARFQLMALRTIPAVIVYPMRSVGTIVVITLAGVLMFREKLSKVQMVALAVILVSLILLNM